LLERRIACRHLAISDWADAPTVLSQPQTALAAERHCLARRIAMA